MFHDDPSAPDVNGNTRGAFEIGSFNFHGQPVIVLSDAAGNWAVLDQLCDILTLDADGQREAIERKAWSRSRTCVTQVRLPGDTQARPHFLIHERIVPMWLANITSSRISAPEIRAKVEIAQVELADALHEYISARSVIRHEPSKLEVARDLVAALEAKEALEAVNRVLAPKASRWDQFMNSEGLIGMTAIADMLDMPVKAMTNWLVELGVFRKQMSKFGSNQNMPRRMYQRSGHFKIRLENNGKVSYEVAYATPAGADFVIEQREKRTAA
ncbi:phage antirepressor KilAC domain-containing protein [Streptomyces sp. NPDC058412]|uniref:phage antirepressor KilAC domain-containing protein n=1 Tax=Streptomyces sp. NPDC058412 TaxID=3346486 RepID=UPI00365DEB05